MLKDKVAVIGAAMIKFGRLFDKSYEDIIAEAYLKAMDSVDNGMESKDIQAGWLGTAMGGLLMDRELITGATLSYATGLEGIPVTRCENLCASGSDSFRNAVLGIASGFYDVAIVIGAEKMCDKPAEQGMLAEANKEGHTIFNYGITAPSIFGLIANRHMHEFGTTKEQMAKVAVKNHENGTKNPDAALQFRVSVEQVLKSPFVSWPLGLMDCCPITDGAAAILLCKKELAKKYTDRPVYVAGIANATSSKTENLTEFASTKLASKRAYEMANMGPEQIDVAEVHDCFTIAELVEYEDLGFCEKGQGGRFIDEGRSGLEGDIAVNPSGGLLCKGHPLGATGVAQISELFHQLRGQADRRQRQGARTGLQHNIGFMHDRSVTCVSVLTV
jgi:acetyl-CoA C-acetyltransferase